MLLSEITEPETLDIVVYKGTSFNRVIDVQETNPATGKLEPTDLSSYRVIGQILAKDTDELLVQFMSAELKDDGKIKVWIKASDSRTLPVAEHVWGLTLINKEHPDTDTTTIIVGEVNVKKGKFVLPEESSA